MCCIDPLRSPALSDIQKNHSSGLRVNREMTKTGAASLCTSATPAVNYFPEERWRTYLMLPAATEGLIELDERLQFIKLGLSERQLIGKVIRFVRQDFQVVRRPGVESLFREL